MSVSRRSFLRTVAGTTLPLPFILTSKTKAFSPDAQIGNMLMVNFSGLTAAPDSEIAHLIRKEQLGGVLLFENNFSTAANPRASLRQLCSDLHSQSPSLLVAMDQEGGSVNRLKEKYGFPQTRSAYDLGEQRNPKITHDEALNMAKSLAQLGINLNFAPVVDIRINPANPVVGRSKRCFGNNPEMVVQHAAEFIRAHRQQQVLTTLKHFPGHGS